MTKLPPTNWSNILPMLVIIEVEMQVIVQINLKRRKLWKSLDKQFHLLCYHLHSPAYNHARRFFRQYPERLVSLQQEDYRSI